MADSMPAKMILVVTGSTLRAEELDRPLAYFLKSRVEAALAAGSEDLHNIQVRVIADFRWIHDEGLHNLPTISVGGPGVNALAHHWLEQVPLSLHVDEQYYIQMDPDLDDLKVSIWGMDNPTTQIAVAVFLDRFLSPLLEKVANLTPEIDLEDD